MDRKKLLIITGELSGDIHGYHIARALIHENIDIFAVGGKNLASLSIPIITDISAYSSVGIIEFLPFLGKLIKAKRIIKNYILLNKPDAVLFIDNQGFNIPLARLCKKLGLKCLYYFPPIVSVWDRKNARIVPKLFDAIICPFEKDHEIYLRHNGNSFHVGHPFIDTLDIQETSEELKQELDLGQAFLIGVYPGSRLQEITALLSTMLAAVEMFSKKYTFSCIIGCAKEEFRPIIQKELEKHTSVSFKIIDGSDKKYLKACDIIIGASGSLAIEAAILGIPMIVCYKISKLSYLVAKLLIKIRFISWPNILSGKEIYPELIQNHFTADAICDRLETIKQASSSSFKNELSKTKALFGSSGVIQRVKEIILRTINNG